MPHGRLTPLGRQLRTVLATLSHASPSKQSHYRRTQTQLGRLQALPCLSASLHHGCRHFHQSPATPVGTEAALYEGEDALDALINEEKSVPHTQRFRQHSSRRLKRRTRIDHIGEALAHIGQDATWQSMSTRKADLSHLNPRGRNAWQDYKIRQKRHMKDYRPPPGESPELSLQRILSSYLRHQKRARDYLEADWETPFVLSTIEAQYLEHHGFGVEDIQQWAAILSAEDTIQAAQLLAQRADAKGPESIPIFMHSRLLRRVYITGESLLLLTKQIRRLFNQRTRDLKDPGEDNQALLVIVVRLLRHAREVYPAAMADIVEIFLQHLQQQRDTSARSNSERIASKSYWLNKLMSLVSLSTAAEPFKDNPHQETAIVRILQYMADHDPTLHLDRQGYRAVIRVQLAQRKTANEQEWAGLKALSWPPWKSDRTAMDALITIQSHGRSRAGETLDRMKAVGYRPLAWEEAAQIYAGWDTDGTPTIQTRTVLGPPGARLSTLHVKGKRRWAARIDSTRTIQEAWACYLSWEDAGWEPDQEVYLAIFKKLNAEDARRRLVVSNGQQRTEAASTAWPLFPGDDREISPPPSSTHLHTYTRTIPPTPNDFYDLLIERGVCFEGHCLGFVVENAPTIQAGLLRLSNSLSRYPEIQGLLDFDMSYDLDKLPFPVFYAAVKLYSRFPNVQLPTHPLVVNDSRLARGLEALPGNRKLNPRNCMARAIELLTRRAKPELPNYRAVLQGLTRSANFEGLAKAFDTRLADLSHASDLYNVRDSAGHLVYLRALGAFNAHRLAQRVISLVQERHIELDAACFHSLCLSYVHVITAAWRVRLDSEDDNVRVVPSNSKAVSLLQRDAKEQLRRTRTLRRLREEFFEFVGDHQSLDTTDGLFANDDAYAGEKPPPTKLLRVPGPTLLHAFVRAMGWAADHGGLLTVTRWMHKHRDELAEARTRDRRGDSMMRKVIIALRVFLERSWIADKSCTTESAQLDSCAGEEDALLQRLRRPADLGLIHAIRQLVDDADDWHGWPTDDEVRSYIEERGFHGFVGHEPDSDSSLDAR